MGLVRLLQATAVGLLAVGWTWASYRFGASNEPSDAAAALAIVPVLAAIMIFVWGRLPRWAALLVLVLMTVAVAGIWPLMRSHVSWLYYLQHIGIQLVLASVFGRTLVGGGDALVTQMARKVHREPLSPLNVRYTRNVTRAWTIYFLGMAVVSTGLFVLAPLPIWSAFANLLSAPLVAFMFMGEYVCRLIFLPAHERPGLVEAIKAWRDHQAPLDERTG